MVAILVEQEGKIMAYRSLVREGTMMHLSSGWGHIGVPNEVLSYNPLSSRISILSNNGAGSIRIEFSNGPILINRIGLFGSISQGVVTVIGIGDKLTFPPIMTYGAIVGWTSEDFTPVLATEVKIEEEKGPIEIRGIDIYEIRGGDYVSDAAGMVLPIDRIDVRKPKVYEESPIKIDIVEK